MAKGCRRDEKNYCARCRCYHIFGIFGRLVLAARIEGILNSYVAPILLAALLGTLTSACTIAYQKLAAPPGVTAYEIRWTWGVSGFVEGRP